MSTDQTNDESRQIGAKWWRLDAYVYDECGGAELTWSDYKVIRVTPKGVWLNPCDIYSTRKPRFALSGCCRWASPTKAGAAARFVSRKRRQIAICRAQIEIAEAGINLAKQWIDGDEA